MEVIPRFPAPHLRDLQLKRAAVKRVRHDGWMNEVQMSHQFRESMSHTAGVSRVREDLSLVTAAGFGVATLTIKQTDLLIDRPTPSGIND